MKNITKTGLKKQIYKKVLALFPELKERRSTMNIDLNWMKDKEGEKFVFTEIKNLNSNGVLMEMREYESLWDELALLSKIKLNISFSKKIISIDFLEMAESFTYDKNKNIIDIFETPTWAREPDEKVITLLDVYKYAEKIIDSFIFKTTRIDC